MREIIKVIPLINNTVYLENDLEKINLFKFKYHKAIFYAQYAKFNCVQNMFLSQIPCSKIQKN